jgi:hypothetical protein
LIRRQPLCVGGHTTLVTSATDLIGERDAPWTSTKGSANPPILIPKEDTMHASHTKRTKPRPRYLIAVLVALSAVGSTLGADSASAATETSRYGSPGYYTVGQVYATRTWAGFTGPGSTYTNLTVPGPTLWRSPASNGPQPVLAQTELLKWTSGGWQVADSRIQNGTLYSGTYTFWPVTFPVVSTGHYTVRQYVFWPNSYGEVYYNQQRDYSCSTLCTTNPNGYITFHWV